MQGYGAELSLGHASTVKSFDNGENFLIVCLIVSLWESHIPGKLSNWMLVGIIQSIIAIQLNVSEFSAMIAFSEFSIVTFLCYAKSSCFHLVFDGLFG